MLVYLLTETAGVFYYVSKYTIYTLTMAMYNTLWPSPNVTTLDDIKIQLEHLEERIIKYEELYINREI